MIVLSRGLKRATRKAMWEWPTPGRPPHSFDITLPPAAIFVTTAADIPSRTPLSLHHQHPVSFPTPSTILPCHQAYALYSAASVFAHLYLLAGSFQGQSEPAPANPKRRRSLPCRTASSYQHCTPAPINDTQQRIEHTWIDHTTRTLASSSFSSLSVSALGPRQQSTAPHAS